jgi:hypothetical protein
MYRRRLILCTHNNYEDPFLRSQLLELYSNLQQEWDLIVFIKGSKGKIEHESGLQFIDYGSSGFYLLNYYRLLLRNAKRGDIYHLRGFISAIVFWSIHFLKLHKTKYIYDPRGSFLDEFRERKRKYAPILDIFLAILRKIESSLIKNSKITIVTTKKFKQRFIKLYGLNNKYVILYNASSLRRNAGIPLNKTSTNKFRFCYVGSINFWHDLNEILRLAKHIIKFYPQYKFSVFTNYPDQNFIRKKAKAFGLKNIHVEFVSYNDLGEILQNYNLGISVVKPTISSSLASPIKVSDYINLEIPFIQNLGIGDFDKIFEVHSTCIGYKFGSKLEFDKSHIECLKPLPDSLKRPFKIETNRKILTQIIKEWN